MSVLEAESGARKLICLDHLMGKEQKLETYDNIRRRGHI